MSEQTILLDNNKELFINTDLSKVFIWENRYSKGNFNNQLYDPLVMKAGTLLGRIGFNQQLFLCDSQAIDGSQFPVGILAEDVTIADGDTVEVAFCNYGDVAEEKVILQGDDTLSSLVSGRSLRDRIAADTVGIRLVPSVSMTSFDNPQ